MAALRKEEILSLAEKAVNSAIKKGAAEAEAFMQQAITTAVIIERGQIVRSSRTIDKGLGIRAIINKAIGFSYTNILEKEAAVEETVLKALNSAKASKPDRDWQSLPPKKSFASVENTYDRKIVELHSEDLVKVASQMLDAAEKTDKRVFPIGGTAGASYTARAIANSNGVSGFDDGTVVGCELETLCRVGGEVTPGCFEFNAERTYNIDPVWVGKEAARLAVSALKARKIESKSTNIIFTQFALQQLLYFTLINAVKADYVQRNQSAFKGKVGEKVASEIVTIYDDGLYRGGLRTWKFDGEGTPQQKTLIIEKGALRNFVYDNYTAKREGKESTGNATRAGYASTPNVEATNFHLLGGKASPEDLIREAEDGLIVYGLQGAHSSNPASGEFSAVATPAWKIENGEIAYATKGAMVTGNIFEVLTNVCALANNEKKSVGWLTSFGLLVTPWVLVENIKVIGK